MRKWTHLFPKDGTHPYGRGRKTTKRTAGVGIGLLKDVFIAVFIITQMYKLN